MVRCSGIVTVRNLCTPKPTGPRRERDFKLQKKAARQELCPIIIGHTYRGTYIVTAKLMTNKEGAKKISPPISVLYSPITGIVSFWPSPTNSQREGAWRFQVPRTYLHREGRATEQDREQSGHQNGQMENMQNSS